MLSINIKALQNVCVKRMDPNFSAKRFVKAPASDSAEEEKPDDISQATVYYGVYVFFITTTHVCMYGAL